MSVAVMAQVFARSQSKGAARLVLLALADVAADTGEVSAYKRSQSVLAGKANCSEGTVRRSLAELAEMGEVEVVAPGGGRKSASYWIRLEPVQVDPAQDGRAGGSGSTPSPSTVDPQPVQDGGSISPSPSIDAPSLPIDVGEATVGFDAFWSAYPRRTARADAERAWRKAVKVASPDLIVAGATRYAAEVAGRDPSKVAHGATWLNGRRWEDPPGANGGRRQPPADRDGPEGRVKL